MKEFLAAGDCRWKATLAVLERTDRCCLNRKAVCTARIVRHKASTLIAALVRGEGAAWKKVEVATRKNGTFVSQLGGEELLIGSDEVAGRNERVAARWKAKKRAEM